MSAATLSACAQGARFLCPFPSQVGAITGLVCRAVRQLGAGATGRLGIKLTTGGIEVDVGGSRRFSEVATGGAAVSVGLQVRWGGGAGAGTSSWSCHVALQCA